MIHPVDATTTIELTTRNIETGELDEFPVFAIVYAVGETSDFVSVDILELYYEIEYDDPNGQCVVTDTQQLLDMGYEILLFDTKTETRYTCKHSGYLFSCLYDFVENNEMNWQRL
jgi:hypothetical protein